MILSKSAFAAHCGVGAACVSKWLSRGHLTGVALTADGRIDVEEAERQLGAKLDEVRSAAARQRDSDPVSIAEEAPPTVREQILAVELAMKRRRLEAEKGVYVLADQVRAERGRALAQMIAAIDVWIADLPGELQLDHTAAAALRGAWRRFRERQADATLAEASNLPELWPNAA